MIIGRVIGNVVSTVKAKGYESRKILIVQPIDPTGQSIGKSFLAIDTVQAGFGDTVITIDEGNSARIALKEPEAYTIKLVVAGIVDHINKKI
ncbi:MAG: EutN/CcmL family microcompartment protein [Bacteroidales bacterium]|nr:EutN/CcmL family microcompartment protein [Bacteroidales bacterium]